MPTTQQTGGIKRTALGLALIAVFIYVGFYFLVGQQ